MVKIRAILNPCLRTMSSGIIITAIIVVIRFVVVIVVIIIGVKFLYLTIALNWWQISILSKIGAKK